MTSPSEIADDQPRRLRALTGALVGLLAAAVAIGAAQFASGLGVPQSSPVIAVGQAAIDLTPPPVKDFAISAFGAGDKTVLLGGILLVLALYAAVVGMLAVRRLAFGMWGLAIFACIGLTAALTRPTATTGYVVPTLVGAAAGAFALAWLARAAAGLGSPTARTGPRGGPISPFPLTFPLCLACPIRPACPISPACPIRRTASILPASTPSRPSAKGRPTRPGSPDLPSVRARPTHLPTCPIRTTGLRPPGPRGDGSWSQAAQPRPWPRSGR